MADPRKTSRSQGKEPTTPESFTIPPPSYPSGDYSYTVELVGTIQNQLGKLTEAVEGLKLKTTEQGAKLTEIGNDVHAAKVTMKIVGAILAAAMAFGGWVANKAVDAFISQSRQPPASHQAK